MLIWYNSQIARNLRAKVSNAPDRSDAPAPLDRIHLLWGEDHIIDENPDDRITTDLLEEIKELSDGLLDIPEVPEARQYLIESVEYKWLLSKILAMARTMPTSSTDSDIRQDLLKAIGGEAISDTRKGSTIKFEMEWHFLSFVEEQYKELEDVELQHVLCCAGLADKAIVAPCIGKESMIVMPKETFANHLQQLLEYAELLWPRLGKETILLLSKGLGKESVRMSGMFF